MGTARSVRGKREDGLWSPVLLGGLCGCVAGLILGFVMPRFDMLTPGDSFLLRLFAPAAGTLLGGLGGFTGQTVESWLARLGIVSSGLRSAAAFTIVICALGLVILRPLGLYRHMSGSDLSAVMTMSLVLGGVMCLLGYRVALMRSYLASLERENAFLAELAEKNRLLSEASRSLAIAEERARIARELHDSVCQGIHGMVYSAHSIRQRLGPGVVAVDDILTHLGATADNTLSELRTMILELRPSILEERGLEEAIRTQAVFLSQQQHLPVALHIELPCGLAPETEMALYRIAQEALGNVVRHARAGDVSLTLTAQEGEVVMSVRDDGGGFDLQSTRAGHGIGNMRGRAEEVGGWVDIESSSGHGTTIVVHIPIAIPPNG